MKNKITLAQLAPYLPYGLKILNGWGDIKTLNYTHLDDKGNGFIGQVKPFLRPLSDLTKEIKDERGNSFILAKLLWSVSENDEDNFDDFGSIPQYWEMNIRTLKNDHRNMDYGHIQKMFKYHFDVFGLIDKGLAININEVKEETK